MLRGEYLMTGSGPAVIGQAMMAGGVEEIDSRFGRVTVDTRQSIFFANGVLGMPDRVRFCITHLPSPRMARFKLLQSLDDHALSFITLPLTVDNPLIERADLELAARDLEYTLASVSLLLIVTVHRESAGVRLTVNARAPVLIDTTRKLAAQYVFPHTKYMIRQPLAL
jgi:flagellar assembly factor FliW